MGPSCVSASTEKKPKTREKIHTAGEAELSSEREAESQGKLRWRIRGADGIDSGKGRFGHQSAQMYYPPFFCGHCSCLQHPQGSRATLGKNKAGLDQTLPLFRFGLESCVQPVSPKTEEAGSARVLAFLLAPSFLNNIQK